MENNEIINRISEYYTDKIKTFGTNFKGVDWNSESAQLVRYQQLSSLFEKDNEFTLCDFGCGYGFGYEYLTQNKDRFNYIGIDISKEMIKNASLLYNKNQNVKFINSDAIDNYYDYIISSGIFNIKFNVENNQWEKYILNKLNEMNIHSYKGFAFNCLTSYSDHELMRNDLYYGNPLFYFDYCKKYFSKNVALLHDYNLYEFTIVVRK